MKMKSILAALIIFVFTAAALYSKEPVTLSLLGGYAAPVNSSYVDTFENQDIYWNPNSGLNAELRLAYPINEHMSIVIPADLIVGYYQYNTTDGRKVNTEAQAGNTPKTVNTEWSFSPSIVPMLLVETGSSPAIPYIGIGAGLGLLWSYETWDFTNDNGDNAQLVIDKFYAPTPVFKGEVGWKIPYEKKLDIHIAGVFTMVNYIMTRVELSHYYINGADTISEYDTKDTVYSYAYNVPDENKGGDCLLAGFAYNNYPQQKISTNFTFKIGLTYHL